MKIFIPGRICILGEHTDWAGGYRRTNSEIEKGFAIITGTNQGIYAEIEQHPSRLILETSLANGRKKKLEIEMDSQGLLEEARKGRFFS